MQWGRRWGNYWGEDIVDPIQIIDFEEIPPAAMVTWDSFDDDALYIVYVDGQYYDYTAATEILVQFEDFGRHWVEVLVAGFANMDEDLDNFITPIPGTRVKLSWAASASTDTDHYDIYWDSGLGGALTYLDRNDRDELCYITDTLADGTYRFRVDPVDTAGNRLTSGTDITIVISRYPNPPSDLALDSYDELTGIATFTFTESDTGSVIGYHVYHNSGSGYIDYDTIIDTILAGNTSFTLPGLVTGDWKVAIRAYNANYEEDNVDVYVSFSLGGSPVDQLDERPNIPEAFSVIPTAGGTFLCKCSYHAHDELGKGTQINFYANDGLGGGVDFSSTVATATIPDHTIAEMAFWELSATSIAFVHGRTYTFIARAATSTGRESENSDSATGVADSVAPDDISALTATAVNYEQCT